MNNELKERVDVWLATLEKDFYHPLGSVSLEACMTYDMLSPSEAEKQPFHAVAEGDRWGRMWEYGWFRGDICLDERAAGHQIVLDVCSGGEAMVLVDGELFGCRRADWVRPEHHYYCDAILSRCAKGDERYHLLLEAYAGHEYPDVNRFTGPVLEGTEKEPDLQRPRQVIGNTTYGVWNEAAYQLWLDARVLRGMIDVVDSTSLRVADIEQALIEFTKAVDFEQPLEERIADYKRARELLRPALEAHNGSTAPTYWAVGHSHIDLSWLWGYRETQRKVARTFSQQLRLMDIYPEYRFIQSQPQAYMICKQLYPHMYARMKEKIKAGQWIAEGGVWVEPDTNMSSGESLVRQIVYGKRFFKDEFGIDSKLLWLPDTFGYSAVLPQLLKKSGIKYITTQKILRNGNEHDPYPYHYFNWQGMDGSTVTAFLHNNYNSYTDVNIINQYWRERRQRYNVRHYLLPFGHGDGGCGPTRDHIEQVLRQRDLEGVPKVEMDSPAAFFAASERDGGPKETYVGEMYFAAHRGTYTSQAAIKRGNRKGEVALRDAEIWSAAAMEKTAYPARALEDCWKELLLNQFHDILPGSSIARVTEEAAARYRFIMDETENITNQATRCLTSDYGKTWFNSLSWQRTEVVETETGYARVNLPPMGWTSVVDPSIPAHAVTAQAVEDGIVLSNGLITAKINKRGEICSCTDQQGQPRISSKANVVKMYKDAPRRCDAWEIEPIYAEEPVALAEDGSIELLESTPWRAKVRVTRMLNKSTWTQDIVLDCESTRLDFITHVDWRERHRLLKVCFPTGVMTEQARCEMQYGFVCRPTHRSRRYDRDRFEVCNHHYTALCDENRGAAVLNDCKYGVSTLGDEISLTLLKAPTAPDVHADQGEHDFTYSYYFWDGTWMDSDVVRQGYALNTPVRAAAGMADTASLMRVEAQNVIIEAVKAAEDGSGDVIVRLYECKNAATRTALHVNLPVAKAYLCSLTEENEAELLLDGNALALSFHVFEVLTVRLVRA